jgi:hypothetical protein
MSKNIQQLFDEQAQADYRQHYQVSDETRAKMRDSHLGKPGISHNDETRAKMSDSLKGKESWNKGIPHTDQAKANISKSKKGKPNAHLCKPLMTPNGVFPSAVAVATAAGVSYVTVWNWIKRWPEHYYYLDKKEV